MTKVNWIIDENIINVYPHLTGKMPDIIRELGHNAYVTKYVPFADEQDYGGFSVEDCVVLYGTHGFIRNCNIGFAPGAFGLGNHNKCSIYMPKLNPDWLLNNDYIMAPWADFKNRYMRYFKLFNTEVLFIRPNSGFKTFAGRTISVDNVEQEIQSQMQLSSVVDETLILISSPKWIKAEFRFVIANKKVVAGSEYRWDGILDLRRDWPEDCENLANQVAALDWQLDLVYTCDIALTPKGPKVIELNSFSCAGLYACDLKLVVDAVNEVAINEYKTYWNIK